MNPAQAHQQGLCVSLRELMGLRQPAARLALSGQQVSQATLPGSRSSKRHGRGMDFDRLRPYQAGDDSRSIDWKVTARTGKPHSRVLREERDRPVLLLVEQSSRLFFGSALLLKSVLAAQAAALLGWRAMAQGERVGGLILADDGHQQVRPQGGKQSLLRLLYLLQAQNQALTEKPAQSPQPTHFCQALAGAGAILQPGALVMLLCDERALDPDAEKNLRLIAQQAELLLLPLHDPLDHRLPDAGLLGFGQGQQHLQLDSHDPGLRLAYQRLAEQRTARWQRLANTLDASLMPLHTAAPALTQLYQQLRSAGR